MKLKLVYSFKYSSLAFQVFPIPLKNSEIVNKNNNKQQNVKKIWKLFCSTFSFFCTSYNFFYKEVFQLFSFNYRTSFPVKISGNDLVQLFRFFAPLIIFFTKKSFNYSVSTTEQVFPLKYREMIWFNYFVFLYQL